MDPNKQTGFLSVISEVGIAVAAKKNVLANFAAKNEHFAKAISDIQNNHPAEV